MKRTLLSLGMCAACALWANGANYNVYSNGTLNSELHVYGWWNDAMNFEATNPNGEGKVFEFKAGTNGFTDASMGINMETPQNTGILNTATLNFSWYAKGTGKYTVRLTSVAEENYDFTVTPAMAEKWNTTSLKISEVFPIVSMQWKENENDGAGYVFSIILSNGSEGDVIYLNDIYYSDVDESWTAPDREVVAPTTVPVPSYPAQEVLSLFSGAYPQATGFNIGYWGQTTNPTVQTIDGQTVYQLRNFNYLGWELTSNIDISDYDYMHVDFWTAKETALGFTPISPGPKEKVYVVPNVVLNAWNSYDVPLSEWADVVDLSDVFQVKFDQGAGVECYLANVFFWKRDNGDNPGGDDKPGEGEEPGGGVGATYKNTVTGSCDQTMDGVEKTYPYNLSYSITYNEDKTLTMGAKFTWLEGEPIGYTGGISCIIPGVWVGEGDSQTMTFTTDKTFETGETIGITFQTAIANGVAKEEITYVVGSKTEGPTTDVTKIGLPDRTDVYDLRGVRILKNVSPEVAKTVLTPGIYIIGGKKILIGK